MADASAPSVRAFLYGPAALEQRDRLSAGDVPALRGKHPVTWIDVAGIGDPAIIARLGEGLGLHRLALHAFHLAFPHPFTGAPVAVDAPLAPDLAAALASARAAYTNTVDFQPT